MNDPAMVMEVIEFRLRKELGFNSTDFESMTPKEVMVQYECLKIQNEIEYRKHKEAMEKVK